MRFGDIDKWLCGHLQEIAIKKDIYQFMPYDPRIHHRRSIRLQEYDYTQPGAYYITICTKARQYLFGNVVKGEMRLNQLGKIAFNVWEEIPEHFPHIELDEFVIMPNHLHGILVIIATQSTPHNHSRKEQFRRPVAGSIPTVLRSYKSAVTNQINAICNTQGTSLVWQRNYYEHIGRNEEALNNIRRYIIENPLRGEEDKENPHLHSHSQKLLLDIPF